MAGASVRVSMTVMRWPTTPAEAFPHGATIARTMATQAVGLIRRKVWMRRRFIRWTGRSYDGWTGAATAGFGVMISDPAQSKTGVYYVPYVHLTRRSKDDVLTKEVVALVQADVIPKYMERMNTDTIKAVKQKTVKFNA